MTDNNKEEAEPRPEQAGRENGQPSLPAYEIAAQATREKMARLRALRLARDAAEQKSAPPAAPKRVGRSASKKAATKTSSVPLSQWLDDQKDSGRRS